MRRYSTRGEIFSIWNFFVALVSLSYNYYLKWGMQGQPFSSIDLILSVYMLFALLTSMSIVCYDYYDYYDYDYDYLYVYVYVVQLIMLGFTCRTEQKRNENKKFLSTPLSLHATNVCMFTHQFNIEMPSYILSSKGFHIAKMFYI